MQHRAFYSAFLFLMFVFQPLVAQIVETSKINPGTQTFTWRLEAHQNLDFRYLSLYTTTMDGGGELTLIFDDSSQTHQTLHRFHEGPLTDRIVFDVGAIPANVREVIFRLDAPAKTPVFLRSYGALLENNQNITQATNNPETTCACTQPAYCDRNCWCPTGNCDPVAPAASITPTHIIVHHSAGSNTSSNFAAVVAAIRDFHVNTNGWDDIGYNWLIDPNGVIYEGRGDGKRGAHFSCMNGGTTGICLLGNYQTTTPAPAAIAALEQLLAWEACDKNISAGNWGWHTASQQHMPHIGGHRDGNAAPAPASCATGTVCPGNTFYPLLPEIRLRVAAAACFFGGAAEQILISAASTFEAAYLAGTPLDFFAQQTYLGDSAQPRPAQLRVYLSQQAQLTASSQLIDNYLDTLDSAQSSRYNQGQYLLPAGLSAGTWYLHFVPDAQARFQALDSARIVAVPFEILGTIGTEAQTPAALLKVFPNPTQDWVVLETARSMRSVAIFDASGRAWLTENTSGLSTKLDVRTLPTGLYFIQVRLEADAEIFTSVLMVERR